MTEDKENEDIQEVILSNAGALPAGVAKLIQMTQEGRQQAMKIVRPHHVGEAEKNLKLDNI